MCTKAQNLVDDRLARCHWILIRGKVRDCHDWSLLLALKLQISMMMWVFSLFLLMTCIIFYSTMLGFSGVLLTGKEQLQYRDCCSKKWCLGQVSRALLELILANKDLDWKCQTERQPELQWPGNDRIKKSFKEQEAESPKVRLVGKILQEKNYRKGLFWIDDSQSNRFVF